MHTLLISVDGLVGAGFLSYDMEENIKGSVGCNYLLLGFFISLKHCSLDKAVFTNCL